VDRLGRQLPLIREAFAAQGWTIYDEILELPWTGSGISEATSRFVSQLRPFASL